MNPIIIGASIGATASIGAALIARSRASAKSDAMQHASPTINISQDQQRRSAKSPASSFFLGVAVACLAVVAIVLYLTDDRDSGQESGQTETEASVATSSPLPSSSIPESTTLETIRSDAVACPDEQEFARAKDAVDSDFSYRELPPSQTTIILQMSVEKETTDGSEILIITVCKDDSDSYWYFSRWLTRPTIGLVTRASRRSAGFDATYDFYEGDIALYEVRPTEVTVSIAGTIQHLSVVDLICADPGQAPEAFSDGTTEPCTESSARTWAF